MTKTTSVHTDALKPSSAACTASIVSLLRLKLNTSAFYPKIDNYMRVQPATQAIAQSEREHECARDGQKEQSKGRHLRCRSALQTSTDDGGVGLTRTSLIRAAFELFGMVTTPHCIDQRMQNCASVTPWVPPTLCVSKMLDASARRAADRKGGPAPRCALAIVCAERRLCKNLDDGLAKLLCACNRAVAHHNDSLPVVERKQPQQQHQKNQQCKQRVDLATIWLRIGSPAAVTIV